MKKIKLFIFASGILLTTSCTTTKLLTSGVSPSEVTDLQKFQTFAYITLIESGNRGRLNDTISNKSIKIFSEALVTFKNSIPVTGEISVSDTLTQKKIEKEVEFLCISADRQRSISNLKITPMLDSLLEERGKRFGLITVTTGFTRTKGNYGGQVAKGAAMGLLTLGMYYQTPIKANSTVYAMIVDAKENNIAFFRKSFLQDKEPLDKDVLTKQIQKIFENYFLTK
jgi:hypothetical protein